MAAKYTQNKIVKYFVHFTNILLIIIPTIINIVNHNCDYSCNIIVVVIIIMHFIANKDTNEPIQLVTKKEVHKHLNNM